jgi:hypothetical protein
MFIWVVSLVLLSSCKSDTVAANNEYITTVKLILQNQDSTSVRDTFQYINFNESQNIPPSHVDTIRLRARSSYAVQVALLNETATPVRYLTDTIIAMADNHLMIYGIDPASGFLSVKMNDKDSKGLPLGLMSTWTTAGSTHGWLRMILRHQQSSKNGTQKPGSTDFEADFPVIVM